MMATATTLRHLANARRHVGYRPPSNDNPPQARYHMNGVSAGVLDANRRMANGTDPWAGLRTTTPGAGGVDPWGGMRSPQMSLQAQQAMNAGWDGFGPMPGPSRLEHGLGVLGAGVGAFANGYQSGSPFSGGLSGAMAGLGAAPAIAGAFPALAGIAGPLGLAGGALAGPVGGFLGSKQQRSAA